MINYYQEFIKITQEISLTNKKPKLLLHSCCAPCSSASLEAVVPYFDVDVFYYNPNITNQKEYEHRVSEQILFVEKVYPKMKVILGKYDIENYYALIKGLEHEKEGCERCFLCYEMRLRETALNAKMLGYDFFASTLSVSPYKNANKLNEIGKKIEMELEISYLPTDFKKNNGYKRSIELSKEYGLYRQNYCGCEFSVR